MKVINNVLTLEIPMELAIFTLVFVSLLTVVCICLPEHDEKDSCILPSNI